jgi:hypothetical protein
MRLFTNYKGAACVLIGALATTALIETTPAFAQATCGGKSRIDKGGSEVIGICDGSQPPVTPGGPTPVGQPAGRPSDEVLRNAWNSAGCGAFGEWTPGSTVSYAYDKPATAEQLQKMGYDPSVPAAWYIVTCAPAGGPPRTASAIQPVGAAGPAAAPVNPLVLRDEARAQIQPARPGFAMSPAGSGGVPAVVALDTWMWLTPGYWQTVPKERSQGAVTVRVEATPVAVRWVMGDGSVRDCAGPGVAWSPGARSGAGLGECTYSYRHASSTVAGGRFHGSVSVTWSYRWWLNGADQGAFGTSQTPPVPFDVVVAEIEALHD